MSDSSTPWKSLELTAQYAQIATIRKLLNDDSFEHIRSQLKILLNYRINSLTLDMISLMNEEKQSIEDPRLKEFVSELRLGTLVS